MKKVEFIRIESKMSGFGIGKGVKYIFEDIRNVIKDMIEKGWSYDGYIPVMQRGTGDVE